MKINFADYDFESFDIKEGFFMGLPAKLIGPNHIGTKFTQKNKIFRSSIWDLEGNLLSASLPKFVNFGENPENFPVPTEVRGLTFVEKIDGSLCCLDYINGMVTMRTRGTFSYTSLENATDFDLCLGKYSKIIDWLTLNPTYSLICEITTPNLKVILDYGTEPEFWLIGAVNKNNYELMSQKALDGLANILDLPRPKHYTFNSIEEMTLDVLGWENREGVCMYSKNDQEIHKIKASVYLKLHRFKENATLEATVDLFCECGYPSYGDYQAFLITHYDYECFQMVQGFVSQVIDSYKIVQNIMDGIDSFVENKVRILPTRKDQALLIQSSYGTTNRAGFCFTRLDRKPWDKDMIKKLMWQVLKKIVVDIL